MISATLKIMWLRLWRDKGALILAFVLPGFIFAVFAAIFSTASGGTLDLRVALANQNATPVSTQIYEEIRENATFDILEDDNWSFEDVREQVRLGQVDVGLVVLTENNLPKFTVIQDPSREVAATVIKGQIRQILSGQESGDDTFETLSAMPIGGSEHGVNDKSVTYYVGATAILFIMFAAMQGASISIDERRSGISERLMVGPKGAFLVLLGKFLFLTFIGILQAAVIIAVAAIFFDVVVLNHIAPLALISFATAMLSAALALFTASLCSSQPQMHTVSTFLVLLFSAIGGSMVPRFMMPSWLQDIGVFTPNYWVIEGYYGILARGQSVMSLWPVWSVMIISVAVLLGLAAVLSHKMMRV